MAGILTFRLVRKGRFTRAPPILRQSLPTHKTTSQLITRDDAKHTPTPWEQGDNGLIYGQCQGDNDEAPFVADVSKDTVSAVLGM